MKTALISSIAANLLFAFVGGLAIAQTATTTATPAAAASMAPAVKAELAPVAPTIPTKSIGADQLEGKAAYYSSRFNGRKTASGQRFNNAAMTAAHNTLPFGTRVKITNTKNNKSVVVRVNDRGPSTPGRVFDLTRAAARKLGYVRAGLADVKAEVVAQPAMKSGKKKSTAKKA